MNEEIPEYEEQPQQAAPIQPMQMQAPLRRQPVPNATTILVMGICSVVLGCFGVGLVMGIIGLVMSKKSKAIYRENPELYDDYGNVQAGFILSIIGICIGGLSVLYYLFVFLFVFFGAASGVATSSGYTV
jgi:hypothetical protein